MQARSIVTYRFFEDSTPLGDIDSLVVPSSFETTPSKHDQAASDPSPHALERQKAYLWFDGYSNQVSCEPTLNQPFELPFRLSLGSCSRDFHNLIKDTRISYYSLTFKIHTDRRVAKVTFAAEAGHEKPLQYRYSPDGHTVQKMRESNEERLVENGNFVEAAVDQFLKIFRNPRVSIREFTVSVKGYLEYEEKKTYIFERIQSYFRSLVHPIAVEKLVLIFDGTHKDILCILPHLKPKTLNSITLERPFSLIDRFRLADIDLRQVAETEQWRNAEQFTMNNFDFKLPIDKWSHFSYTSLEVNSLTADEAKDIYHVSLFWNCTSDDCLIFRPLLTMKSGSFVL